LSTPVQLEEQIYACEGFQVRLTPLNVADKKLPSYDFLVMSPQKWRISDWKTLRLRAYVPFIREIAVLRGDGSVVKSDIQLGTLRDTYYQAKYGALAPGEVGSPTGDEKPRG
jgi:hypothetical protein